MIGIVDYGVGNLRSVENAFEAIGFASRRVIRPEDLKQVDKVVLPGVGAFADCRARLDAGGWPDALLEEVARGKPLLGICVGMQLLSKGSTEHGLSRGLDLFDATCDRFPEHPDCRVPHMGWNSVTWRESSRLGRSLPAGTDFYFVHSYRFGLVEGTAGVCDYVGPFCAAIERDNVWGVQFHPEKSQGAGLVILSNFASLAG